MCHLMSIFNVISLFGGLALFLYGMRIMGDGLKQGSSATLKRVLEKVTNNPLIGFLIGVTMTAVIQSSTATIVITSGLVGAGILTFHQSVGIVLGANVGTTITAQIIRLLDIDSGGSFIMEFVKPSTLAPLAAILGIVLIMFIKTRGSATAGSVAMGFGILFTGLLNMSASVSYLSDSPAFYSLLTSFSHIPVLVFLAGTAATFVIQSSSATIGILQAMATTGAMTFSSVYAIIIGVNIGDCVTTAICCSIGSKADAKRTGIVHVLFNVFGSAFIILALLVLHHVGALAGLWDQTMTSGSIANIHTIFRLATALVLLPFVGRFERLSKVLVKDDKEVGTSIGRELSLLDEKLFSSPSLALASAYQAIMKMADLAKEGTSRAFGVIAHYDRKAIEEINANEDRIDQLADAVDHYLIQLSSHVKEGQNNDHLNFYIQCFSEFERIGDYAINLTENAQDREEKSIDFSPEADKELQILSTALNEILELACASYSTLNVEAAKKIEPLEEVIDDIVATLRKNHIRRLRDGICTMYSGLTFLDILVNAERISDQCSNIAVYTLSQYNPQIMQSRHEYIRQLHQGEDATFNQEYREKREKYFSMLQGD